MRSLLLWTGMVVVTMVMAEQTTKMTGGGSGSFNGQFCFHLENDVNGYEVKLHFSHPVSGARVIESQIVGDSSSCSDTYLVINKPYQGKKTAGQDLCIRFSGQVCGGGTVTGTGTLVDMDDGEVKPRAPHVSGAQSMKYNYAEVMQLSLMFYEAQRSGKLPANNRIPWRGDSGMQDKGAGGEDLTGGWYDAGDNVKFGFPMAWSATMLCWSYVEYPDTWQKSGQADHVLDNIRWPLEYFIKCHTKPNELYVQVGGGNTDHAQWTRPEDMDSNRPAYKVDASHPGSDVVMQTAAAMACGSIAFKTKDPTFSSTLLTHAKQLYDFGKNHQGEYSVSVPDAANFYKSQNYTDENNWGAFWLHWATGQDSYLQDAQVRYAHEPAWGFSWDEQIGGNHILCYKFLKSDACKADLASTMDLWSKSGGMRYTPKCLAFRMVWGANRYASNTAFLALLGAKYGMGSASELASYRQWGMCQLHYALGDTGRSFVVGYGTNPPTQPHHRGASCPVEPLVCNWDAQQNSGPNPHTIYGALVGGPGAQDDYTDSRTDFIHNEVACDYNAGFTGGVTALLDLALHHQLPDPSACSSCPQP